MDVETRMRGRAIRFLFGLGVLFTLLLLWLNNLSTPEQHPSFFSSSRLPACEARLMSSDQGSRMNRNRSELYQKMATDLDTKGATFLDGGETSQSLKFSDLFTRVDNQITPVLKPANPPVRANVLHLQHEHASKIARVVETVLSPHFPDGVWYQDPELYHFSLFHASHHLEPVPASANEIELESAVVGQVAKSCCVLDIVLDRVVLMSTGVLLGCWQVLNGTDPATIREELRNALPRAPKTQLYSPAILHTSFARVIGPLDSPDKVSRSKEEALSLLKELVLQINEELCDFQATVRELWFVEELDILALALRGRIKVKELLGEGGRFAKIVEVKRNGSVGQASARTQLEPRNTPLFADSISCEQRLGYAFAMPWNTFQSFSVSGGPNCGDDATYNDDGGKNFRHWTLTFCVLSYFAKLPLRLSNYIGPNEIR